MISDIVCEFMVKRKLSTLQILKAVAVFLGGFALTFLISSFGAYADRAGMMGAMLFMVGIFVTVFFGRWLVMIEYEYCYVNGELSFDKIYAKSKRRHLLDVDLKAVEKMGRPESDVINSLKVDAVKDYSASVDNENTIFIYYKDSNSTKNTLIFFTPNQKMLDAMKTAVTPTVYRECFSKTRKQS